MNINIKHIIFTKAYSNNASTNFAPTITKFPSSNASTAEATGNFGIECGRQNMLMSEYYGGDGS